MSQLIGDLINLIPAIRDHHAPDTALYHFLKTVAHQEAQRAFAAPTPQPVPFGPFGDLAFPYHSMGNISSLNLFDLDELIIFSFYWQNRNRYRRAVDVGANIGLHSIVMARCGFSVTSYEPDPTHFDLLKRNLTLNHCDKVAPRNAAVSSAAGTCEFIRLLDNTTGSHLAGAKPNPYGPMEKFQVRVEAAKDVIKGADLAKIDAEGHEKEILLATTAEDWKRMDALIEVGSEENARGIYDHFARLSLNLFAQKSNWAAVRCLEDMPTSYRDGTLFVTKRENMPWD
jgi:FkbM family methyltransferase